MASLDLHNKRVLAALAIAVVLPLAIVESIAAWRLPSRVPTASDWESAQARVRSEHKDGELIVFAPAWLDQIGRSHLGDRMPLSMVGRASEDRYGRVWVVGLRNAVADAVRGGTLVSSERFGQLTVSLWEKPSVKVLYDFVESWDQARISVLRGADDKPCLVEGPEARKCPQSKVERRTAEVDYQPRRSLLVPIEAGATTRIEYDVTLGSKLVVFVGLHDYYARKSADGKLDVRVSIDGAELRHVEHGNNSGWQRLAIDTPGMTGQHTVRIDVSAKSAAWRIAAIAAEVQQ